MSDNTITGPRHPIRLLHSDIEVPHTRLHVTSLDQLERGTGVAFTATLSLDGHTVGTIENDGNGGETWLRHHNTHFDHVAMAAFTAACRRHDQPVTEDQVLNALVDEYDTDWFICEVTTAGNTVLRLCDTDGDVLDMITVNGHSRTVLAAAIVRRLAKNPDHRVTRWQHWDGARWSTLEKVPAAPVHQPFPAATATARPDVDHPAYPQVTVRLTGRNGNAYAIIGAVAAALRRRVDAAAAERFTAAALGCGSYDALLQLAMSTVTVT